MVLEVAHYIQVVVSWIAQALRFYSNKMKTEQSSSDDGKQPFNLFTGTEEMQKIYTHVYLNT